MDLLSVQQIKEFLPDISIIAGQTWGVAVTCLCLIPLFLSVFVLLVYFFQLLVAIFLSNGKQRFFALWLICGVTALIVSFATQWWALYAYTAGQGNTVLVALSLGVLAYGISWAALLVFFWEDSFKIKIFLIFALLYASLGFFLVWLAVQSEVLDEALLFASESLLFVAIGILGIFVFKLSERIYFLES